jgi:hypothetical protein
MPYDEGLRRLRLIVHIVLLIGLSLITAGASVSLVAMILSVQPPGFPLLLVLIGIYVSVVGGVMRIVLWVVEGFLLGPKIPQR